MGKAALKTGRHPRKYSERILAEGKAAAVIQAQAPALPAPVQQEPAKTTNLNIVHLTMMQGYRFKDKDPILATALSLIDQSGLTDTAVAKRAFISPSTIRNWRFGTTRRPQHITIKFVLRAIGYELVVTKQTA